MRLQISVILILAFFQYSCLCQIKYDYNWTFGDNGGVLVDFRTGDLRIKNYDMDFNLSSANTSLSDSEGNFLFYSNGCRVYNKNFELMLNGDSLGLPGNFFCSEQGSTNPMSQNVIAIPKPTTNNIYFLLHHDFTGEASDLSNFYLSTIDMNEDNGLGAVTHKREIVLTDAFSRNGIEVTRHSNGVDWWIIIPRFESNCYHIMLLTKDGIIEKKLQCLGTVWDYNDVQGQMDFSPSGTKFARFIYAHGLNLFDFNTDSGEFSNPLRVDFGFTDTIYHTGVIFSPNSRFVYASAYNNVFQYDLDDPSIEDSRVKIATLNTPDSVMIKTKFMRGLLAPNGKIYIGGTIQYNHLHIIHNPDCKGLACNLEQYAVQLNEFPHSCAQGVPNIPHFRNQPQDINCDTVTIITSTGQSEFQNEVHELYPNPVSDILNIEVNQLVSGFTFKMYDLLGKEIISVESKSSMLQYNLGAVSNGIYFYQIIEKGRTVATGKVQKID